MNLPNTEIDFIKAGEEKNLLATIFCSLITDMACHHPCHIWLTMSVSLGQLTFKGRVKKDIIIRKQGSLGLS
jgi:hypothetical protein